MYFFTVRCIKISSATQENRSADFKILMQVEQAFNQKYVMNNAELSK